MLKGVEVLSVCGKLAFRDGHFQFLHLLTSKD